MCSWEEIGQKWDRAQQMGWQAVQAAIDVGDDLTQKKIECLADPDGSKVFYAHARKSGIDQQQSSKLMRLALHRDLIEESKPESMRSALALLPKVPRKVGEKALELRREEVDKYKEFATETAKKQAEILAKKMVHVELGRLQNEAHDAMMTELSAVKKQLKGERERVGSLMREADEKRERYQDLINRRMNGYDFKAGIKVLRQAIATDREEPSPKVRTRAMQELNRFSEFFSDLGV